MIVVSMYIVYKRALYLFSTNKKYVKTKFKTLLDVLLTELEIYFDKWTWISGWDNLAAWDVIS